MPPASLESLNALAASSQRYGLENLMAPWVVAWSSPLFNNDKLDFSKGDDLITWLNVCLIFGQEEMFKKITRRAIITATAESLDISSSVESPFREIIEAISLRRITVVAEIITVALALLARYQTAEGICKNENTETCHKLLMNSVLEGPMSFGLYQPVPLFPYPGMSAMGIVGEIKDLQLRTDPSHSETCGREVKMETIEKLRIVIGILELVGGLDLSNFQFNMKKGQIGGVLLQIVEDQEAQTLDKEHTPNTEDKTIERLESRESTDKEQTQGPGNEINEGRNERLDCSEKDDDDEKDESSFEHSNHINEDVDSLSATSEVQVPAGVLDGFSETEDTIEDFGPQVLFKEGVSRKKNHDMAEDEGEEQGQKMEGLNDTCSFPIKKDNDTVVYVQEDIPVTSNLTPDKEQPAPTDEVCASEETQAAEKKPNSETEKNTPPKAAPLRHAVARANAEAQGQTWSTPGSELARKYQRGPRIPFSDAITAGDVSNEGHIADLKILKDRFPTLNIKVLIASLKQANWNLQLATETLRATENTPMNQSDGGVYESDSGIYDGALPMSNTPALEPVSDNITKGPDEYLQTSQEDPMENPVVEDLHPFAAVKVHNPVIYKESSQTPTEAPKGLPESPATRQVSIPDTVKPAPDVLSPSPQELPDKDSNIQKIMLRPATPGSGFDSSSPVPQEMAQEGSTATQTHLPPAVASIHDRSSPALRESVSEHLTPKEAIPQTAVINRVSISRLIAGKLTKEEIEKRFWPAEEATDIKRGLAVSANRKTVKKLVHRFPESTADKGLIDVLYRTGWDLEKATSRLEGLGLVRRAN